MDNDHAEKQSENAIEATNKASFADPAVRSILIDVLGLTADQVALFDQDTPLFGALPELDSMAVAGLLTEMEDRLEIIIEDDEVDGELFETFGNLVQFAEEKMA